MVKPTWLPRLSLKSQLVRKLEARGSGGKKAGSKEGEKKET